MKKLKEFKVHQFSFSVTHDHGLFGEVGGSSVGLGSLRWVGQGAVVHSCLCVGGGGKYPRLCVGGGGNTLVSVGEDTLVCVCVWGEDTLVCVGGTPSSMAKQPRFCVGGTFVVGADTPNCGGHTLVCVGTVPQLITIIPEQFDPVLDTKKKLYFCNIVRSTKERSRIFYCCLVSFVPTNDNSIKK